MKKIILLVSFLISLTIFLSCKQHTEKDIKTQNVATCVSDTTKNDVEIVSFAQFKSKDLYVKNCKFCHGEVGKGDGIKARLNSKICPHDLTKENKPDKFVYYVILNGTQVMPDHQKMNNEQIWMLVIHIKKFKDK